jgi:hypothetical protein
MVLVVLIEGNGEGMPLLLGHQKLALKISPEGRFTSCLLNNHVDKKVIENKLQNHLYERHKKI